MKIQKINPADIEFEKPDATERTFNKDACKSLAQSIDSEGLLHEPILRPIPGKPGKYRPITGRNRLYACYKILGWNAIPCKIAPESMGDKEAKAMEYAENLFRVGLNDAQTLKAMAYWKAAYEEKHPEAGGKGSHRKQEAAIAERIEEAKAKGEVVDEAKAEEIKEEVAQEHKPFSKVLQDTLQISKATAARFARIATLEPEQIDVLVANKVTNAIMEQLASLGDKALISNAIGLIASGMDHQEAVRQADKKKREAKAETEAAQEKPAAAKGKASEPKAPKKAPPPAAPKDKDLTDEEWLEKHCGPILKLLRRKSPFKKDAILYRRLSDQLAKFRGSAKKPLAEAKHSDGNGAFFVAMLRVVRAAHPSQWLVCRGCDGRGVIVDANDEAAKKTCSQCGGGAYKIKFED